MKSFARKNTQESGVDVTPLLDIVFQLLLFFILTSALLQPNIELDLPESKEESGTAEADLIISADKEGRLYFNDKSVLLDEVEPLLRDFSAQNTNGLVVLRIDKAVPYGSFFPILDASNRAGIKNLHLAHEEN
ncbi:MAG: biopolymer transporter ExbD [Spirochaetaceae bacterium]|jgi:biopolymer transport protein ExbD|nr:biopolymer transporter ExbD [Spirochaetaceae bacterium]